MNETFILPTQVTYRDVDRTEVLSLPGVFRFLQEAAIRHANAFDTGTHAMATRGETWVLNRMAVNVARYPRFDEMLRIETWSSGIKGFKGYRDFRVYDADERCLIAASSLWLYVSVETKAIVRVPREVAADFPTHAAEVFCPKLEGLEFAVPEASAPAWEIGLRYSDVDVNNHVNNTAYLELVQTALARAGLSPRPAEVRIKYAKAIPAAMDAVNVRIAAKSGGGDCHLLYDNVAGTVARFSVEREGVVFAVGEVEAPRRLNHG